MNRIENFAAVPAKDQIAFATALVKTINSEKTFHAEAQFELTGVEPDDLTGGLAISVEATEPIEVCRAATWICDHEDEAYTAPERFDAEFDNFLLTDAKAAFKTLETVIDGYKIELDVSDADETDDNAEVEVENISHEDAGIGGYEYFGWEGHDSRPYIEVTGTLTYTCDCGLTFFVEPMDEVPTEPEVKEEN